MNRSLKTKDYSLTMRDSAGRTVTLSICGDSIRELIESGISAETAKEEVEGNAFGNAIAQGEIGADAWLV